MKSLRWAVIGTGMISHSIVPDLLALTGSEIVQIYARTKDHATSFAEQYAIESGTDDYDAILRDPGVDVIYLATPFATHHAMARQALMAGKHVLVEKPMTMDRDSAADLFAVAREHRRFVMEAMWTKFSPSYRRLIDALRTGVIGEPRSMSAGFGFPFHGWESKWDMARSGGALLDQGIYLVTLAYSIFGDPVEILGRGTVRGDGLDITEEHLLRYANGRFAFGASSLDEYIDTAASINGTEGWITVPGPFWVSDSFAVHTAKDFVLAPPEEVTSPTEGNGFLPMLSAVSDAIRDGLWEHPTHGESDTLAVLSTLDEIRRQLTR